VLRENFASGLAKPCMDGSYISLMWKLGASTPRSDDPLVRDIMRNRPLLQVLLLERMSERGIVPLLIKLARSPLEEVSTDAMRGADWAKCHVYRTVAYYCCNCRIALNFSVTWYHRRTGRQCHIPCCWLLTFCGTKNGEIA
jgi:hypothetical protein